MRTRSKFWQGSVALAVTMLLAIGVRAVSDWRAAQPLDRAQADALFLSIDGFPYPHLKTYFPADAEAFVELSLALQARDAPLEEREAAVLAFFSDFRLRHAAAIEATPDANLIAVLEEQADLYRALLFDPGLCSRALVLGPAGLTPADRMNFLAVSNGGAAQYAAMHAGITTPVQRAPLTDDEMAFLGAALAQAGGVEMLDRINGARADDPALCPAYIAYLDALAAARFPGADKARALVVSGMFLEVP